MLALGNSFAFQINGSDETYAMSQSTYTQTWIAVLVMTLGAVGVGAVMGWLITQSIVHPVAKAVELTEKVAAGDLTQSLQVDSNDEIAKLIAALANMSSKLQTTGQHVRLAAESISRPARRRQPTKVGKSSIR